jgi:uncharacterized protein YcbX
VIQVSSLHSYPIKSCAGISHDRLELDRFGPKGDRRHMIVDPNGQFITQRTEPRLALVHVSEAEDHLELRAAGVPVVEVPLSRGGDRIHVEVWRFRGEAEGVDRDADEWLSAYLDRPVRLVRCTEDMPRIANRDWTSADAPVAFSDGYPILLISEASLDALNERIGDDSPLPMARFRPNVVVRGCDAFAEDDWRTIQIGDQVIDVVKPCDRCAITTVDPDTAITGREPLATLATFRRSASGVLFGQNCVARGPGVLCTGDSVTVLERGANEAHPAEWRIAEPR